MTEASSGTTPSGRSLCYGDRELEVRDVCVHHPVDFCHRLI